MNQGLPISSEERQNQILSLIETQSRVVVSELSELYSVSEATIRRDLRHMAKLNLLRRVHGGALRDHVVEPELPFLRRTRLHGEEKQRIGAAAAGLIEQGETVILIGGSTTLAIVPHLAQKKNLTVITDSLLIAQSVARNMATTVILLGGVMRNSELTTGGRLAYLCLQELRANKVFMGVRAVDLDHGLFLDEVAEVANFHEYIKAANETILVVDQSKFGRVATAALGPITLVHRVVIDAPLAPEILARLRALEIDVMLA